MKLQKPDLVHSPISYCRQQASRKSVTGDSSEYTGRPPNHRPFCVLFATEFDVHVADQVIAEVVAHVHLLDFAVLVLTLDEHVLEKVVVVFLHLLVRHVRYQMAAVRGFGGVLWIDVQILQQAGLRERRLVVNAGAAVPMTAGANFEVERTVNPAMKSSPSGIITNWMWFYPVAGWCATASNNKTAAENAAGTLR
uniref:Uncharacterized protein n=1 Tax=Anopheles atroparvus TaxID=41427 RepID=A0A182JLJ7_ANOAO